MGIMTAYTGKFMPLIRRVGDPVGGMFAMPGSPKIRGNHMPAVTMIGMTAHTQKPDGFVKPARVFCCMGVVTYAAFVSNIRRMIALFAAPFLLLLSMTFVAQLWNRVSEGILWLCLGIVTGKTTPDKIGPMDN